MVHKGKVVGWVDPRSVEVGLEVAEVAPVKSAETDKYGRENTFQPRDDSASLTSGPVGPRGRLVLTIKKIGGTSLERGKLWNREGCGGVRRLKSKVWTWATSFTMLDRPRTTGLEAVRPQRYKWARRAQTGCDRGLGHKSKVVGQAETSQMGGFVPRSVEVSPEVAHRHGL